MKKKLTRCVAGGGPWSRCSSYRCGCRPEGERSRSKRSGERERSSGEQKQIEARGRGVVLCEREGSRAGFVCRRFLATQATAQLLMGCGTDEEELRKEENNNLGVDPPAGPEKRSNLPREASAADMTLRQQTWYCSLVRSKKGF